MQYSYVAVLAVQKLLGEFIKQNLENSFSTFELTGNREKILHVYESLTSESLSIRIDTLIPRFSVINNDGIPFEFSISTDKRESSLRILTEVGTPGSSLPQRINITCERLCYLFKYLNFNIPPKEINTLLANLLPKNVQDLSGWRGGFWIAVGFSKNSGIGLRIYINNADGDIKERWLRAINLLKLRGKIDAKNRLIELIPYLSSMTTPLGLAFDILPGGIGKIKLYLRTYKFCKDFIINLLTSLELKSFCHFWNDFSKSIHDFAGIDLPDQSLVISLEFPKHDSANIDIKIDVCSHCILKNDYSALKFSSMLASAWSLDISKYKYLLDEISNKDIRIDKLSHHAFHGIGINHSGELRLNIYLKPSIEVYEKQLDIENPGILFSRTNIRKKSFPEKNFRDFKEILKVTLADACRYILMKQSNSGFWIDYNLPVGPSDAWITAYTGLALSSIPADTKNELINDSIYRAAAWSLAAMHTDFGWGYNSFTESDADSTAYTILFLSACHKDIPQECYNLLLKFKKEDGGFCTYKHLKTDDSWGQSHPDVTPVAFDALNDKKEQNISANNSIRQYILGNREKEGLWKSFWWETNFYSTWVNLKIIEKYNFRYNREKCLNHLNKEPLNNNPFTLALHGCCLSLLEHTTTNHKIIEILYLLTKLQEPDGSWKSSAALRLTPNNVHEPWLEEKSGEIYYDVSRIFTTATVINCISNIINYLPK